jgi:hypothetical protein
MQVGVWTLYSLWRMGPPRKQAFGHPRLICLLVLSFEMLVHASTFNVYKINA